MDAWRRRPIVPGLEADTKLARPAICALPGRGPVTAVIRLYTRRMLWAMHWLAGIKVELKGKERLPEGAFIVAAKHQSWGDGFVMFANTDTLVFVTVTSSVYGSPALTTSGCVKVRENAGLRTSTAPAAPSGHEAFRRARR